MAIATAHAIPVKSSNSHSRHWARGRAARQKAAPCRLPIAIARATTGRAGPARTWGSQPQMLSARCPRPIGVEAPVRCKSNATVCRPPKIQLRMCTATGRWLWMGYPRNKWATADGHVARAGQTEIDMSLPPKNRWVLATNNTHRRLLPHAVGFAGCVRGLSPWVKGLSTNSFGSNPHPPRWAGRGARCRICSEFLFRTGPGCKYALHPSRPPTQNTRSACSLREWVDWVSTKMPFVQRLKPLAIQPLSCRARLARAGDGQKMPAVQFVFPHIKHRTNVITVEPD